MKNVLKIAAVTTAALALASTVQAVPITGNIGFSGATQLDTGSATTATEVLAWVNTVVDATSGSFTTVPTGSAVSLATPWFFNSPAPATPGAYAMNNFWSVGGFTFNLTSSSIYSQDSLFLDVILAGTVTGNGYSPTAFTGTFQVGNPPANGETTFTERLSFNSVPDGGITALLLGTALTGLAFIRRKSVSEPAI